MLTLKRSQNCLTLAIVGVHGDACLGGGLAGHLGRPLVQDGSGADDERAGLGKGGGGGVGWGWVAGLAGAQAGAWMGERGRKRAVPG